MKDAGVRELSLSLGGIAPGRPGGNRLRVEGRVACGGAMRKEVLVHPHDGVTGFDGQRLRLEPCALDDDRMRAGPGGTDRAAPLPDVGKRKAKKTAEDAPRMRERARIA